MTRLPRTLYTAAQVRELDRFAIEQGGIPGAELMERAASVVLNVILQRWPQVRRLIVVAGTGNNGGDGYLVAALAAAQGLSAQVFEVGESARLQGDALAARERALAESVACSPMQSINGYASDTVVVDALLGTGFNGELRPQYSAAITVINDSSLPVVAVDVPSGLHSDTGVAASVAVCASVTVCFIGLKQGLFTADGPNLAGEIVFHDLGLAEWVLQCEIAGSPFTSRIDINSVTALMQPRRAGTHKGECGHVLVVGGDVGYGGAALMAAEAATRAGAGTVSLLTRAAHVTAALARRPEVMVRGIEDPDGADAELLSGLVKRADVVVIGPGLGRTSWSRSLLRLVLQYSADRVPLVVDADALNLLAEAAAERRETAAADEQSATVRRQHWVLTPHPGEAGRLLGCSTAQVQADRFAAVRRLQSTWGGVCLLKGAGSLISYESNADVVRCDLCTEGNPGMATGGMGDVLSGLTGAFIAQGLSLADSVRCAVCVHGESADLAASVDGERGLLASDLFVHIQQLVNNVR
ncbi:MAG: NAD(P)H-hydrate dehydratase [Gammaproteobacteria bacterium]|nr:NAD(P)H-hydrate dehydratase [Gammaproteobacteria bacterium]MDP2142030.1 NAD(P)H-hydrate dehydratase [Gammaproteobacteria bacterium]MDP2348391.1 NAD(P)H-hydrate dehydratase [Gammaproteobacteria bacterium]